MTELEKRFIAARQVAIAADFQKLNPRQREGVLTTEGPLLLLAGAGSGKTTVLINRVANLLRYGRGSDSEDIPIPVTEDEAAFLEEYAKSPDEEQRPLMQYLCAVEPARPWEVLAITFTNKAANELKERLGRMLGEEVAQDVWASTFHSACVRILRRDIDRIGFDRSFTIYDTDDSKRVIKDILKELSLDEKAFPTRELLSIISRAKDEMQSPEEFPALLDIFNRYPIRELTVHPRVRQEFYRSPIHFDWFDYAVENSRNRLCYNGNLCTPAQIRDFEKNYPHVDSVMIGRGLIGDPGMLTPGGTTAAVLEAFFDELLEAYTRDFGGSRNAMFRLKENWFYLLRRFEGSEKLGKQLRKTTDVNVYKSITSEIFHTLPLAKELRADW